LFITAGVVLGPFLLIAAIIILMRRRTHPDVV
jgi:nitrate reductase gamma subunit